MVFESDFDGVARLPGPSGRIIKRKKNGRRILALERDLSVGLDRTLRVI